MKRHSLIVLIAIAIVFPTAHAAEKSTVPPSFHPPQTAAEKALDEIVTTAIAKPEMFPIILQKPGFDLSRAKEFEPFFTDEFLVAWRQFEKEDVDRYCGRKYRPGKKCGYQGDPVVCAIPSASPSFYRTVMGDDQEAVISRAPVDVLGSMRTYYLRYEQGRWKIGGLGCEQDLPDTIPFEALVKKFRQPTFDSEKRLEEIFRVARKSKEIVPFILDLSWRDPSGNREFPRMFTPALLHAWKKQAKTLTEQDCDKGYYEAGKGSCNLGPHPIYCELINDDLFVVRTTVERGHNSIITYSYSGGRPALRFVYRMTKDGNEWKLDGIHCDNDYWFNMP